ncbi:hypothetical protein C2U72_09455 [Prosthecomicrobium hirschii]|uniref:hypothetical protein n=1 Tax=Prosthecodimorpha hirschii TaxID=665126 RepID=UPI00112A01C1|nr:hypothetical protein [Prosthecomicrobium hirschii]TPQ51225.1 hypothetical protein C2U72_09455 [Prosthecomicrobium hirschii]
MSMTKIGAVALILSAAAIGAASAEPDDAASRSSVYDAAPAAAVYEGRQATPILAPTVSNTAGQTNLQWFEQREMQDVNKN